MEAGTLSKERARARARVASTINEDATELEWAAEQLDRIDGEQVDGGPVRREHAILVARAQRSLDDIQKSLCANARDLAACEGAPEDTSDEAQRAFWEPFWAEAEAEGGTA